MSLIKLFSICLLFCISVSISAQETKGYKLTDKAYGLAWDGISLWYIDTSRRALIKINATGEQEIFNLGLAKLRGISFDNREGRLLIVAPKLILKINPNTGGITDRIAVPIQNLAGVASVGNFYYLLDLENSKVHIYDKSSSILVGGFFTDRTRPRDICFDRDSIWISDSSDNSIYKYDTKTSKITGSIKTNIKSIRGLFISGSKIWVVDRESHEIKSIPFTETERFIASGEEEYSLEVTVKFKIENVSISKAQVAISLPPSNEGQRIRAIKFADPTYKVAFIQRNRVHLKKMSIEDTHGEQVVKYKFTSQNRFVKYYVADEYMDKEGLFPPDTANFQNKSKENSNLHAREYLDLINSLRLTSPTYSDFRKSLLEMGIPVLPYRMLRLEQGKIKSSDEALAVFLLGFGWLPLGDIPVAPTVDKRHFEKKGTDLIIYQGLSSLPSISPVYFRKDTNSEWENLPAEVTYKFK